VSPLGPSRASPNLLAVALTHPSNFTLFSNSTPQLPSKVKALTHALKPACQSLVIHTLPLSNWKRYRLFTKFPKKVIFKVWSLDQHPQHLPRMCTTADSQVLCCPIEPECLGARTSTPYFLKSSRGFSVCREWELPLSRLVDFQNVKNQHSHWTAEENQNVNVSFFSEVSWVSLFICLFL
jgi:hypothetical protein